MTPLAYPKFAVLSKSHLFYPNPVDILKLAIVLPKLHCSTNLIFPLLIIILRIRTGSRIHLPRKSFFTVHWSWSNWGIYVDGKERCSQKEGFHSWLRWCTQSSLFYPNPAAVLDYHCQLLIELWTLNIELIRILHLGCLLHMSLIIVHRAALGQYFTFHGKVSLPSIGRNRSRRIYVDKRRALQPNRGDSFMTPLMYPKLALLSKPRCSTRLPLSTSYNRPQEQHWVNISPSTEKFLHHTLVVIEVGRFM